MLSKLFCPLFGVRTVVECQTWWSVAGHRWLAVKSETEREHWDWERRTVRTTDVTDWDSRGLQTVVDWLSASLHGRWLSLAVESEREHAETERVRECATVRSRGQTPQIETRKPAKPSSRLAFGKWRVQRRKAGREAQWTAGGV